ncbi:MAG: phosphoglucosamine mutase [Bacteroidota bacterium]
MSRLFGTDGVRGVANRTLTPELAFGLGRAAGAYFKGKLEARPRIIMGRDTRVSGEMLESALAAGITSVGLDVVRIGVLPTPGVAFLCRKMGVAAGVMISASHNPVEDNGIKFFDKNGFKLTDAVEDEIEALYRNRLDQIERPVGTGVGRIYDDYEAVQLYEDFLLSTVSCRFDGLRIVVDCGFGAAYDLAPRVFRRLGAEVVALHDINDGSRINVKCGSTHPGILQKEVVASGADLGIAHDGDADRVIAVDETGRSVDGDQIITVCGLSLKREGKLKNNKVAVTVYSNLGLIQAFKRNQVEVAVTANGDRYVLEAMQNQDLVLGGEQSGHIIFLDKNSTGDGILTALQLTAVMVKSGERLSKLAAQMERYPQVLENVRVSRKEGWDQNPVIKESLKIAAEKLENEGRIFVRASGTEALIRVMAEGPDEGELQRIVHDVAEVIKKELGT